MLPHSHAKERMECRLMNSFPPDTVLFAFHLFISGYGCSWGNVETGGKCSWWEKTWFLIVIWKYIKSFRSFSLWGSDLTIRTLRSLTFMLANCLGLNLFYPGNNISEIGEAYMIETTCFLTLIWFGGKESEVRHHIHPYSIYMKSEQTRGKTVRIWRTKSNVWVADLLYFSLFSYVELGSFKWESFM